MDDPRFWILREALSSYASDPDDPPVEEDDVLLAAVSVVVRGTSDLEVLLIKRAHHEGDPWSGHMALPGGRWETFDGSLLATAIRETREETGVHLSEGLHLGRLDLVRPTSPRLPRLAIHPHVFGVPSTTVAGAASREVDRVHWISVDELRDPEVSGTVEIVLPGGTKDFPCLNLRGEVVWGLTYRILTDFLRLSPEEVLRRAR